MAMPEFSVIIPFKFGARFAEQCFRSVARGFKGLNIEVLVIFDEPAESERRVILSAIERWSREIRIVVHHSQGHGISSALNYGIEMSRSDFLVRHDIDDLCFKWRGERLLELKKSRPDFIFGSIVTFPIPVYSSVPSSREEAIFMARRENPFFHPAAAFRKAAVEELGGYNSESDRIEDYDLWVRVLASEKQILLDRIPHTKHRLHRLQFSRKSRGREVDAIRSDLQKCIGLIENNVTRAPRRRSVFSALKYLYKDAQE